MDALFSEWECQQMTGQTDLLDAVADALDEPATGQAAPGMPSDGTLFALRPTTAPTRDGALFGIGF
ncbi:hypothetical protein GCM10009799_20520 [Nocardiopsis rhodophaea]|uniref:Uncharacterized protein n=1 Tax=Nocardiopsis rhodophaea TaxID=280238 RepID=A0ABN2SXV8_9ACTN